MIRKPRKTRLTPDKPPIVKKEIVEEIPIDGEPEDAERDTQIQAFALSLMAKRSEAIKARAASGVEQRWIEDMNAYNGRDDHYRGDLEKLLTEGTTTEEQKQIRFRSTVFIQKTRQKTNSAAARMSDMLFPTDDRNWALEPTPVPELMDALRSHANELYKDPQSGEDLPHPTEDRPLTVGDMATETMKIARDRCIRMQTEIDDQLVECLYHAEGRKIIDDAAQLGTGILKGPVAVNRVKRSWEKKQDDVGKAWYDLKVVHDARPASMRVDPWNAFPAPGCGEDVRKAAYFWEREIVTPTMLKGYAALDGYDADAILKCMEEGPSRPAELISPRRGQYIDSSVLDKVNYDLWHYWGEVNCDDLRALGVPIDEETKLQTMSAIVVLCNDRVIKAILNPQSTGEIPYCFFQWERVSGSPWGVGVPYLMRSAQRSMNAAWRQMQDNAGVSHGPQIVADRSQIVPADGDWTIRGMKLWWPNEGVSVSDITKAFTIFNIPSNQKDLANIFMMASTLADEETSMPMLMQGDRGTAPDKVGVATILMNSANTVLKRYARNFDDQITVPHLQMYYDWNMEHNENQEIKGDYQVRARGSTHLVVRDQQKQDVANIIAMTQDPEYAAEINKAKLAKHVVQISSIPDVLYTEEEKAERARQEAQRGQPQDPRIAAAQIQAQGRLQIEQMKAQAMIAAEQTEAQSEAQNIALNAEKAARDDEREIQKMMLQRDLEILKMANAQNMQVAEIKAQLAQTVMKTTAQARQAQVREGQKQMGTFKKPKQPQTVQ